MDLHIIIKNNLKENEKIYILRESELDSSNGIMNEFTYENIFDNYKCDEKVKEFWHEDGLCIILH